MVLGSAYTYTDYIDVLDTVHRWQSRMKLSVSGLFQKDRAKSELGELYHQPIELVP